MAKAPVAVVRDWFERVGNPKDTAAIDDFMTDRSIAHRVTLAPMRAGRCEANGRHTGDGIGVAAMHGPVVVSGMTLGRVENDRIDERWDAYDFLGMYERMGAL